MNCTRPILNRCASEGIGVRLGRPRPVSLACVLGHIYRHCGGLVCNPRVNRSKNPQKDSIACLCVAQRSWKPRRRLLHHRTNRPPECYSRGLMRADRVFGTPNVSYERRLVLDHLVCPEQSDQRQRFEALARALRDLLAQRWLKTERPTIGPTPSGSTTCRWSS